MTVRAHCMVTTYDPTTNTVLTSATVNVYNPGTVTPISATIFDRLGNTLSNPLTSDATTGLLDFYVNVAQEVDLVVSKGGFTTRTYSNVPVIDDSSLELTALLTTTGDLVYASGNNSPARLPVGSNNNIMYANGGAPAYNANINVNSSGNMGIGTGINPTVYGVIISGTLTSASTAAGLSTAGLTFPTSTTGAAYGIEGNVTSTASSFTMSQAVGIHAAANVKGSGSTIGSSYGILVEAQTVGTTANYGIVVSNPSGGASANVGIQITAVAGGAGNASLQVTGGDVLLGPTGISTSATSGFVFVPGCAGAPTGVPSNGGCPMIYDTTNNKLWVRNGGTWRGVVLS